MDRRGASLAPRSKRVLAQGRRIASHLGATLYAVASENEDDNDTWIAEAGLAGADKVVLLSFGSADTTPELSDTQEPGLLAAAMMAVSDALSPHVVLLDNNSLGTTMAPALGNHLAAQVMLGVTSHVLNDGDIILEERTADRRSWRHVSLSKSMAPIIATISTTGVIPTNGRDDADVIFFKAPRSPTLLEGATAVVKSMPPMPSLDGDIVVCAGIDALPVLTQVRELAHALNAPLVSTKALAQELDDDSTPIIDWDAHRIAPRLYLCCGDDGADSHLGAISLGTQIISIGSEPRNKAISASRYALLGSLSETLSELLDAVTANASEAEVPALYAQTNAVLPLMAPALADAFTPCPDAVELFSDSSTVLARLRADKLWNP